MAKSFDCNLIYYNKPQNTCEVYNEAVFLGGLTNYNIGVTERY